MLPLRCILGSEDKFYSFVGMLDAITERYAKEGITLAYHHHNWEYVKLSSGKTRMEELLTTTTKIKFVHDTYWTARCGIDPVRQIQEFGTRLLGIHLRDLAFSKKLIDVIPHDTFIGDGVIDFKRVICAAKEVGCEYMVVEQKTDAPYENITKSIKNLEKLRSEINE